MEADNALAFDLVPVALGEAVLLPQGFGVAEQDGSAAPAAHHQFGVSGGQVPVVQQIRGLRLGRDGGGGGPCGEAGGKRRPVRPAYGGNTIRLLFHRRDRTRYQHPGTGPLRVKPGRFGDRGGRGPRRIVVSGILPAPGIAPAIHLLSRARGVVAARIGGRDRDGRASLVADRLPGRAGIGDPLRLGVALQQKRRLTSGLRQGSVAGEVPNDGRQHVAAGVQVRPEVDRFITPVERVAARRPPDDAASVHEELVAVVAADVHGEAAGFGGQIEAAAEMIDAGLGGRCLGRGDPVRRPGAGSGREGRRGGCRRSGGRSLAGLAPARYGDRGNSRASGQKECTASSFVHGLRPPTEHLRFYCGARVTKEPPRPSQS